MRLKTGQNVHNSKRTMPDIIVYLRSQPRYGDQVVSFPTLFQLKSWWPEARIRVVAKDNVGSYYRDLPWSVDFQQVRKFGDYLRAVPRQRCITVNLHHSSEKYGLVNLLRRPKMRLGFNNGRFTDFVWTHDHQKTIEEYIGLANLNLLAKAGPVEAESAARSCFEEIAAPAHGRIEPGEIVFIPGGGSGEFKRWSWRHYVRLADLLKRELGGSTVFTFVLGPAEALERANLLALNRKDFRLESGRSIAELSELMRNAKLVVANDCGPSHIAQGLCVPYVGIFNEPNPEWFWKRPYSEDVVPTNGTDDINSITAEAALQACLHVMPRTAARLLVA